MYIANHTRTRFVNSDYIRSLYLDNDEFHKRHRVVADLDYGTAILFLSEDEVECKRYLDNLLNDLAYRERRSRV